MFQPVRWCLGLLALCLAMTVGARDFESTKRAAEQGDAKAQYDLGMMYVTSTEWYRREAWLQSTRTERRPKLITLCNTRLADCGEIDFAGFVLLPYTARERIAESEANALLWFRKAAEQGHAMAQYSLGVTYLIQAIAQYNLVLHTGVQGAIQSEAEAARWFREAAQQGQEDAQYELGVSYLIGRGIAQNDAEGAQWFRKAAEQGHAEAQVLIGKMYATGQGVAQNDAEAVQWYHKAAEQGNGSAQYQLGVMYATGRGVAQSESEAVQWYRKAAQHEDWDAKEALKRWEATGNAQPPPPNPNCQP